MPWRGGKLRIVRWAGCALTLALPPVWAASAFGNLYYDFGQSGYSCGLAFGSVALSSKPPGPSPSGWEIHLYPRPVRPSVEWLPQVVRRGPYSAVVVPLWLPWLAIAGLTIWRWRADRLIVPHACSKCGYDRRGLAMDAKCPECGTVPTT